MLSFGYIIDSQICVVALYLLYVAFLQRRIVHTAARAYLLAILPIGLLLPLIKIPVLPSAEVAVNYPVVTMPLAQGTTTYAPIEEPIDYLWWIYLLGVALMGLWLMIGLIRLVVMVKRSRFQRISNLQVAYLDYGSTAYSILNYVFISESLRGGESFDSLLDHERCHVENHHTWDLIFINLAKVVLWFNPVIWHMATLLRQVHEYQADNQVIAKGYRVQNYVNLLINSQAGTMLQFTNQFSYSLTKKRLTMLTNRQRATSRKRLILTLPVIATLLVAFSLNTRASKLGIEAESNHVNPTKLWSNTSLGVDTTDLLRPEIYLMDDVEIPYEEFCTLSSDNIASITILRSGPELAKYDKKSAVIIATKGSKGDTIPDGKRNIDHLSSQNTQTADMYILNGKEVSFDNFCAVDVKHIAEVSVLKGNDAVALYGEKVRKNGVVVVSTKKETGDNISPNDNVTTQIPEIPASERPTYILDGVKISYKKFRDFDIAKIMSMTVLKGNDAVALYGEKVRKNGVVIVSTQRKTGYNSSPNGNVAAQMQEIPLAERPTYILDGVEVSSDEVEALDVAKIKIVTVLKDNDAVALHGEKVRKNGVVIISTKGETKANM